LFSQQHSFAQVLVNMVLNGLSLIIRPSKNYLPSLTSNHMFFEAPNRWPGFGSYYGFIRS